MATATAGLPAQRMWVLISDPDVPGPPVPRRLILLSNNLSLLSKHLINQQ